MVLTLTHKQEHSNDRPHCKVHEILTKPLENTQKWIQSLNGQQRRRYFPKNLIILSKPFRSVIPKLQSSSPWGLPKAVGGAVKDGDTVTTTTGETIQGDKLFCKHLEDEQLQLISVISWTHTCTHMGMCVRYMDHDFQSWMVSKYPVNTLQDPSRGSSFTGNTSPSETRFGHHSCQSLIVELPFSFCAAQSDGKQV